MIIFSFDYPPNDGGISRLCEEIVKGLSRKGIRVNVLTQEEQNNRKGFVPDTYETRVTSKRPWRELYAIRKLRYWRKDAPIICGIWYPEGLLAIITGIHPVIIFAHGLELFPTRSWHRRYIWNIFKKYVFRNADLIVADSQYSFNILKEQGIEKKAEIIPLAVDSLRFSPGDKKKAKSKFMALDKFVITSVSRILSYKGHEVVFRALANLPRERRNRFIYLIAGRGPDKDILAQISRELGVESSVRWMDFIKEEDLPDFYRAADLFVLCTRENMRRQEVEGFGLVFLEAQACGTPVVGTRTGGITDAIKEGDGGWLIAQDDANALTNIIIKLEETPSEIVEAGIKARARIERESTWDSYFKRFLSILEERNIRYE